MKHKVAIQGIKGSFHHKVAQDFFSEDVEVIDCNSFQELVNRLIRGEATDAVMAIENSIAGSIIPNYALLDHHNLNIEGERYLAISQNLMVMPGQKLEDIHEVWSHPMALLQCKEFFKDKEHIRLVEDDDTAGAAKRIADGNLKGIGAIAGTTAASIYGLDVIAHDIQTIKDNSTRFFVLNTNGRTEADVPDKASVKFLTDHKRGSLAAVLNVMSDCRLNLTKIQSLPVIETPWKYSFFVDVTFEDYADFEKAKKLLDIMAQEFKILGEYKNRKS
ncbi:MULTISPECIES: prephenate dehydratase [Leeuwenhoekiella]|uniref:prephenate dehydratase n=1 Tax=Leeuwenhoekiella blandensis (strain CECT 7118 / CCUG 51940 / KCTC 22103 / MED217) TaxID=398720 RepID=A3XI44_LEEBM|nr:MULTISPECIES: prephenate dehydratase [Leeuwenhoekiella]EAQ51048.1 prephenate dehydratase [Leeuwenhoekiella blandensis MED217]MAO42749.1 prephenate dehydratase [Leeuwenhoekiella sp.]HBT10267.1 prephenate dehydratase [Leeuwenhoekiella sp.]HCW65235.1 prephenate dehydratase [Leeuwenhoekiella sp.]